MSARSNQIALSSIALIALFKKIATCLRASNSSKSFYDAKENVGDIIACKIQAQTTKEAILFQKAFLWHDT